MTELSKDQLTELERAFDLTQDSGHVDQYGAKKMLQIFNMNPTTEEVNRRFTTHGRSTMTFDEFKISFHDYLIQCDNVPATLSKTLSDLFESLVTKSELRRMLTEMGSEPFDTEEADEVLGEIPFDEDQRITQQDLTAFLLNKVDMRLPSPQQDEIGNQSQVAVDSQHSKDDNQSKQEKDVDPRDSPEAVNNAVQPEIDTADNTVPKTPPPLQREGTDSGPEVENVITSDEGF